jgi:putative transposase
MEIMFDHIHLFVSASPKYAPSTIAKIFKGVIAKSYFNNSQNFVKNIGKITYGLLPTM